MVGRVVEVRESPIGLFIALLGGDNFAGGLRKILKQDRVKKEIYASWINSVKEGRLYQHDQKSLENYLGTELTTKLLNARLEDIPEIFQDYENKLKQGESDSRNPTSKASQLLDLIMKNAEEIKKSAEEFLQIWPELSQSKLLPLFKAIQNLFPIPENSTGDSSKRPKQNNINNFALEDMRLIISKASRIIELIKPKIDELGNLSQAFSVIGTNQS